MSRHGFSAWVGLTLACYVACNVCNALATQPRTETGELIPLSRIALDSGSYVPNRIVCHTYDAVLALPGNDEYVDIEDAEGSAGFVSILDRLGVMRVKRVFEYAAVEAIERETADETSTSIQLGNAYIFELGEDVELEEVMRELESLPMVMTVELDYYFNWPRLEGFGDWVPKNDDLWSNQWNLHDPDHIVGGDWGIGCPSAWSLIGYGDSDTRIGVIEKLIRGSHVDFFNGDGDGFVEGLARYQSLSGGWEWSSDPAVWDIDDSHGNPVAGIVGARSFNDEGVRGVAGGNDNDDDGVTVVALCFPGGIDLPSTELSNMIIKASDPVSAGGENCTVISLSSHSSIYCESNRIAIIHAYDWSCPASPDGLDLSVTQPLDCTSSRS